MDRPDPGADVITFLQGCQRCATNNILCVYPTEKCVSRSPDVRPERETGRTDAPCRKKTGSKPRWSESTSNTPDRQDCPHAPQTNPSPRELSSQVPCDSSGTRSSRTPHDVENDASAEISSQPFPSVLARPGATPKSTVSVLGVPHFHHNFDSISFGASEAGSAAQLHYAPHLVRPAPFPEDFMR